MHPAYPQVEFSPARRSTNACNPAGIGHPDAVEHVGAAPCMGRSAWRPADAAWWGGAGRDGQSASTGASPNMVKLTTQ